MRLKFSIGMAMILLAGILAAYPTGPAVVTAQGSDTYDCQVGFKAGVYQGPDAGLKLDGSLVMKFDASGGVTGLFMSGDSAHTQYPLAGQVNGRAINLVFDLGKGKYLYGVGTALSDIQGPDCGKAMGGPLVGPSEADLGGWDLVCIPFGAGTVFQIKRIYVCTEGK